MGFFRRLLGICQTRPPADSGCWSVVDGRIEVDLNRAPELSTPGGAVRLEGRALSRRVLIVHGVDGQLRAFPNRCTHAGGRRLDPVPGESVIRCCSVGQSVFDYEGRRLSGSAQEPLTPLRVQSQSGKFVVWPDE